MKDQHNAFYQLEYMLASCFLPVGDLDRVSKGLKYLPKEKVQEMEEEQDEESDGEEEEQEEDQDLDVDQEEQEDDQEVQEVDQEEQNEDQEEEEDNQGEEDDNQGEQEDEVRHWRILSLTCKSIPLRLLSPPLFLPSRSLLFPLTLYIIFCSFLLLSFQLSYSLSFFLPLFFFPSPLSCPSSGGQLDGGDREAAAAWQEGGRG